MGPFRAAICLQKKSGFEGADLVARLVFKPGFEGRGFAPGLERLHIGNDIGDILGG